MTKNDVFARPFVGPLVYVDNINADHQTSLFVFLSLPAEPPPMHMSFEHTENHWASMDTFKKFIAQVASAVQEHLGAPGPWLLLLDLAPIHISRELIKELKDANPGMSMVFIPAGSISVCQPLDRSWFRSFKFQNKSARNICGSCCRTSSRMRRNYWSTSKAATSSAAPSSDRNNCSH